MIYGLESSIKNAIRVKDLNKIKELWNTFPQCDEFNKSYPLISALNDQAYEIIDFLLDHRNRKINSKILILMFREVSPQNGCEEQSLDRI